MKIANWQGIDPGKVAKKMKFRRHFCGLGVKVISITKLMWTVLLAKISLSRV